MSGGSVCEASVTDNSKRSSPCIIYIIQTDTHTQTQTHNTHISQEASKKVLDRFTNCFFKVTLVLSPHIPSFILFFIPPLPKFSQFFSTYSLLTLYTSTFFLSYLEGSHSWPSSNFLISVGLSKETHISEDSKPTSTNERKQVMFAFLSLSQLTEKSFFQPHQFT